LAADVTTLAEALKQGDYRTAMIGEWHVGGHARLQGSDDSPCFAAGNNCPRFQGPQGRFMTDMKADAAGSPGVNQRSLRPQPK
jgi:arylsulfatase A-like enzyme